MLWLGGFLALEVTTSTPDAFAPRWKTRELRFGLASEKSKATTALNSPSFEGAMVDSRWTWSFVTVAGVLHRELPLDEAGCQDAAQALALVLERYFDAIEKPSAVKQARIGNRFQPRRTPLRR